MGLLSNRKIALLITVIVVALATLFGVGRSLNNLARNVEEMFYIGVFLEDAGFTQPGISMHLGNVEQAIINLTSVFASHEELSDESEALVLARRNLLGAGSISAKYAAYQDIQRSYTAFVSKVDVVDLSERDMDTFTLYDRTITGAMTAIQGSEYNVKVGNYMDGASFIAYFLRPFLFVTSPQVFG